jgi:hypothetical protein
LKGIQLEGQLILILSPTAVSWKLAITLIRPQDSSPPKENSGEPIFAFSTLMEQQVGEDVYADTAIMRRKGGWSPALIKFAN